MWTKNRFFLLLIMLLLVLNIASCGNDDSPTDPTDPTDPSDPEDQGAFPTDVNQFGLYSDSNMSTNHISAEENTTIEVYMVITNPYNEEENHPIESVGGVEFSISYPHESAINIRTTIGTGPWVNVGDNDNVIAGVQNPIPVVDDVLVLGVIEFLLMTNAPFGISIGPANPASIDSRMAIYDPENETIHAIYPASGSHDDPVFGVNTR